MQRPSSTPAFDTSSRPTFGTPSVPAFGSTSTPAFGASSTPAFGFSSTLSGRAQSTIPTFGSYDFGKTLFGGQHGGSREVPYTSTNEPDAGVGGQAPGKFISISAMPQYKEKSHEELRWKDYQWGDKGGANPASQQPAGASLFSQPAQSSPFGQTTSTFGQTPSAFGQTSVANPLSSLSSSICANKSSPFGGAAFGPSFGSGFCTPFGASSSTSPFGTSSSPSIFASSTTSTGGVAFSSSPFGVSSTPAFPSTAFSQASQPGLLFSSTPSLGSSAFGTRTPFGNAQSSGPFQSSTSTFGRSTPTLVSIPAFGASNAPAFGASSTPAFGASSTTPSFGFGSTSAFGRSSPAFGSRSIPAFGSTPSSFGDHRAQSTTPTLGISGFGHTPFWEQHAGSKSMPYTSTNEADGGVGGQAPGKLISISAMSHYKEKSHEELRWEDYQLVINPALVSSSMPTFGSTSGAFTLPIGTPNVPAFGISSTTPSFGFGSISENPDSGGVDTVSARLDKVTAEMERLRLEVEALRVERDGLQEEKDGGRDGVVVAVLEKQLRQAQQDAQYYAGEASYYHGMLITHAPGAPVPPYSQLASHHSHSPPTMNPLHGRQEGSRGHEGQGESSNGSRRDHPQHAYVHGTICIVYDV